MVLFASKMWVGDAFGVFVIAVLTVLICELCVKASIEV